MVIMDCVVYGLRKKETETILYVGSTKNITERKQGHKDKFYNPTSISYNFKIYNHIRENGGWEVFEFIILETIEDILTKRIREQFWINKYGINNLLNEVDAYITEEERKERVRIGRSKRYNANKELYAEKMKAYYELNKEELAEKGKVYRAEKKEEIRAFKNRKVMCDCGIIYTHSNKNRHCRSKTHLSFYDN